MKSLTGHMKKISTVFFLILYMLIGYSGIIRNSCCMNVGCTPLHEISMNTGCSGCSNELNGNDRQICLNNVFLSREKSNCSCDDFSLLQCEAVEFVKPEHFNTSTKQVFNQTKTERNELVAIKSGLNHLLISQNQHTDFLLQSLHTVIQLI